MNAKAGTVLFLLSCTATVLLSASPAPLIRAHSHNDYLHTRPLADALAHGFRSVEADVWLTNGVLLVAHDLDKTEPGKTLQKLYLDPLRAFVRTNVAMRSGPALTLLIDVKSEAESTYEVLQNVLKDYADILTTFESNTVRTNAVMVIISGNRAQATMKSEPVRLAAIDGRLPDLDANPPVALVPLVSDNWTRHFKWRGAGEFPEEERAKLRGMVQRAHAQGRRLRLWATPDNSRGWKELHEAGVDLLNTDDLAGLGTFLRAQAGPDRAHSSR
jgi:glycerophosphoryl diester phosphodiesterase